LNRDETTPRDYIRNPSLKHYPMASLKRREFLKKAAVTAAAVAAGLYPKPMGDEGTPPRRTRPRVREETREERVERLRHVKISKRVIELFRKDYSHNRESAYMLFRDNETGVIDIAVNAEKPGTKGSYSFTQ